MAAFTSVPPFPGATPETQMTRPGPSVARYCHTPDCRNGIRLSSEDKLCEKCQGQDDFDSSKDAMEEGELPSEPLRACVSDTQVCENRQGRRVRHQWSSHVSMEAQSDLHATHLVMLDERQQNRARKLERETEEVDGRWRTIQSVIPDPNTPPPRPSRSRRPAPDRGLTLESYRPKSLHRPYEINTWRPEGGFTHANGSAHSDRLYESTKPATYTVTSVPFGPSNKRKSDVSSQIDFSNKSTSWPSHAARCGKRQCNNVALAGKDRCQHCYGIEGRHHRDERRRCASSDCTHVLPDASKEDLCKSCFEKEISEHVPGSKAKPNIRGRICSSPSCKNQIAARIEGKLCKNCLAKNDNNNKNSVAPWSRVCSRNPCKNPITATTPENVCQDCLQTSSIPLPITTPFQQQTPAPIELPTYESFASMIPFIYQSLQQFQHQQYQHGLEPYKTGFHPYQQEVGPQPLQTQFQQISRPLPVYPQQSAYPARQLVGIQPRMLPQRSFSDFNFASPHTGQHLESCHQSYSTSKSNAEQSQIPVETHTMASHASKSGRDRLQYKPPTHHGLPDGMQPLSDISSSARRLRVMTMQRMLQIPCFGCLQHQNAYEASTHPQIYCIHLPSTVRCTVLLDHEHWKQMCASGREAEDSEFDSVVNPPVHIGNDVAVVIKQEEPPSAIISEKEEAQERGRITPTSVSVDSSHLSTFLSPNSLQEHVGNPLPAPITASGQFNDPHTSSACEPQNHVPLPAVPADVGTRFHGVAKLASCPNQEDSRAIADNLPENGAIDSVQELLELKKMAEPGSPLEVAVALQQELRNCLLVDVTEGDPQEGEPSAIGLLRVLDPLVESLQAGPRDG